MYPHLVSNIYQIESRISFPAFAESRQPTAESLLCSNHCSGRTQLRSGKKSIAESAATAAVFCPPPPSNSSCIYLATGNSHHEPFPCPLCAFLCVAVVKCLCICIAFSAPRSRVPAALAQIAIAATMTEPTASLGGSSRASRIALALFRQRLGGFPPAISAALLSPIS